MDQRKPRRIEPELGDHAPLGVDPRDAQFHARRMRQAKEVGPLGKFFRYGAVVLVLVGVGAVVWNFDTVSRLRFDFSAFSRDSPSAGGEATTEPGQDFARNPVAGESLPTSLPGEEQEEEERVAEATAPPPTRAEPREEPTRSLPTVTTEAAPEPAPAPAPPREPEPPPGPETFGFASTSMNVSEADASAAVLVLRDGDRRRPSSITWWTVDGSARGGADFASLGRTTLRFAATEQNRGVYVPIVGDRAVEGAENFFIHIAAGDSTETLARIEVVILDDD
jgi:Calx-beta domain-containing protein